MKKEAITWEENKERYMREFRRREGEKMEL